MSGSLGFCQNTPLVGLLADPTLDPEGARRTSQTHLTLPLWGG